MRLNLGRKVDAPISFGERTWIGFNSRPISLLDGRPSPNLARSFLLDRQLIRLGGVVPIAVKRTKSRHGRALSTCCKHNAKPESTLSKGGLRLGCRAVVRGSYPLHSSPPKKSAPQQKTQGRQRRVPRFGKFSRRNGATGQRSAGWSARLGYTSPPKRERPILARIYTLRDMYLV